MIRLTTPRAVVDWLNRPITLEQERSGVKRRSAVGLVGRTNFRCTWELDRRMAEVLLEQCAEGLESDQISDSIRNALEVTRKQVQRALDEYEGE